MAAATVDVLDEDANAVPSTKTARFEYVNHVKETHKLPIFGACFDPYDPNNNVFATVGGPRASIYECDDNESINLLQAYTDKNPDEILYTCAWTFDDKTGAPLLAVAGLLGVIKVINTSTQQLVKTMIGHGDSINEMKFHPNYPHLLVSASKDMSVRLWNIRTECAIAVFGGEEGHRDEVLSIDFHHSGQYFVSCGMDNRIKIWLVATQKLQDLIAASETYSVLSDPKAFPMASIHFPEFSSNIVHRNYVDCVRYYGDLILSKSTDNHISLWKPDKQPKLQDQEGTVTELQDFKFSECEIWYVRFCLDVVNGLLFCGTLDGRVFIWDANSVVSEKATSLFSSVRPTGKVLRQLSHPKCKTTIRQVCLSFDSRHLIAVGDDSTVWRWDSS